jgi:putative cardiolipin synthase
VVEEVAPVEKAAAPPPLRRGNKARLLVNGEASFLERMRLIDEAERSIYIQALIFKADTVGYAVVDRLIQRQRERPDLDIRVIVDAYSNVQDFHAQMLYFELMDAGIDVQGYEAFYLHWMGEIDLRDWTAGNKRYHEKYWVVDGTKAIVGGMNIGDEYARIGSDPALIWRDQDIYLEGEVVADVERAFLENFATFDRLKQRGPGPLTTDAYWDAWRAAHPRLREVVTATLGTRRAWERRQHLAWDPAALARRRVASPLHDDVAVQFVRSRPRVGERWIDAEYLARIGAAERSVVIANAYFVPTAPLLRALADAARRGVEVTVITNSKATNDIPIINDAGRLSYRELIEAGVAMYEWHAERIGEGTLHAKYAVFDAEVAIIGSYNLDPRSLGLNSEDVVVVHDARIASELHARTMEVDLRLADRITLEQAREWEDLRLVPLVDEVPLPWDDPRFDPDQFELFLIRQVERNL